ncbi:hypothetical protein L6164_031621 [Bauhinia variegata]|uniref:Uncharacterized protein n=1 Tax=Bauhinia variegata TaxID=167791 RepID=A0ACB9LGI1_BAUVA|nr:hypothetical protein L6164_031621 [Bauhinia variegata]
MGALDKCWGDPLSSVWAFRLRRPAPNKWYQSPIQQPPRKPGLAPPDMCVKGEIVGLSHIGCGRGGMGALDKSC